jgi:hypothetical protein
MDEINSTKPSINPGCHHLLSCREIIPQSDVSRMTKKISIMIEKIRQKEKLVNTAVTVTASILFVEF